MQKKKEDNLLKKLVKKDYKDELEEVLEGKYFGENAKSLLLEILYKIETAYKDYEVVKKDAKTKDEYFQDYINNIKNNCKTIKIVKPNSEQSKLLDGKTFLINKRRKEITCLPIARKLLYAVSKIEKKEKIVKDKYFLLSQTLSNLINIGDCINAVEPLREFNGWSWTTVIREIESPEYNIIYQVLLILVGRKFMQDWVKNGDGIIDYVEELENILTDNYGKKMAIMIINTINELSIILELKVNPKIKEDIEESRIHLINALKKFEDKESYVQELTIKKNRLQKQIMKIDTTINDKKILQQEYVKRNEKLPLEEKIFSIRILANMLIEEREQLFKEMESYNLLLKPKNFIEKREKLQKELGILNLANIQDEDDKLYEKLLLLQQLFLECFKMQISRAKTKEEIVDLIYRFRYYCLLPFNAQNNIYNLEDIKEAVQEIGKMLIRRAVEFKVIIFYSINEDINYEIMKNIFKIRVISLENLSMKLIKEKEGLYVQFFDEKASDQKIKVNLQEISKKELNVKLNKKVDLFE